MDILLRDIDPVAIKKIDELAKEKGVSRQYFLKGQIEMLAFFQEQTTRERHLTNLIDKNLLFMSKMHYAVEQNTKTLNNLYASIEKAVGEIEDL
ncbi:hypothetical protein PV791_04435 [Priestia filamentosa]|uniref:hypothetical protein n=1 Tax=Priestia filamentosa TaxID=1402861 RepID=UPI0038577224